MREHRRARDRRKLTGSTIKILFKGGSTRFLVETFYSSFLVKILMPLFRVYPLWYRKSSKRGNDRAVFAVLNSLTRIVFQQNYQSIEICLHTFNKNRRKGMRAQENGIHICGEESFSTKSFVRNRKGTRGHWTRTATQQT